MPKSKINPEFARKMTSMRVGQQTLDFCASTFKSLSGGAGWLTEWAANTLGKTLPVALERLDLPERLALIYMHNGHMLNPQQYGPEHLALMVRDSAPNGLPAKLGYDTKPLAAKCKAMTATEAAAVAIWACGYWTARHWERVSPEEYADVENSR